MGIELERKFLVVGDTWKKQVDRGVLYTQGYLHSTADMTIRIRIIEDKAFLTLKGITSRISRSEYEYPIPMTDAEELLKTCSSLITKYRYRLEHYQHVWSIDVFTGDNDGLIIAEIELSSEVEDFQHPNWLGKEVSQDCRYYNSKLVTDPFSSWSK